MTKVIEGTRTDRDRVRAGGTLTAPRDVEGRCSRCRRLYYLEPVADNGLCCICNRDDDWTRRYGPDWRERVRSGELRQR